MKLNLRLLYLYLFSFVGLIVAVIGSIRLIELGLKVFVFKDSDKYYYVRSLSPYGEEGKISTEEANMRQQEEEVNQNEQTKRDRQRETAGALAMLIVGFPLYKYHWGVIQKEHRKEN